jgi:hypothetical protein
VIRIAWSLLAALALAGDAFTQESRPSRSSDPASDVFASLDSRIYSAEREGLNSVEFSYRPHQTGPLEQKDFRVRVRWAKGQPETIDFLSADGKPLGDLPDLLKQPAARSGGTTAKQSFEQGAKSLLTIFRGVPFSEQFRNWRKRLETGTVNGREERTIVLEPLSAGYLRRVEIHLDPRDLPWRIVSSLTTPEPQLDRMIDEPTWSEFDGKLLMTGFKKTRGAQTEQIVVNYQRKDGIIVPASYERLVGKEKPVKFVFEEVVVNPATPSRSDSRPK